MLKGNNKGFAITTVLYGLSIMGIMLIAIVMTTMSNIRKNNNDYVRKIEEELNNMSMNSVILKPVVGDDGNPAAQEYMVVEGQEGFYRIELWGCRGTGASGGLGAYTSGLIHLNENDKLYLYVCAKNSGHSTEIRVVSGSYNNLESAKTRIMVAAGGGSGKNAAGGTLYGYTSAMVPLGADVDINTSTETYGLKSGNLAGTNNYSKADATIQGDNIGNVIGTNGGGTGYYSSTTSKSGGTSYIFGYAGVKNYSSVNLDAKYMFLDGMMYAGVNSGEGKARIQKVSSTGDKETLKKNETLKTKYRYIKDCIASDSKKTVVISVVSGKTISTYSPTSTPSGGKYCVTVDLKSQKLIDEIAVWHGEDGKDIQNHTLSVSTNGSNYNPLISDSTLKTPETVTGIRVSAYQITNTNAEIRTGNYYLMPIIAEGSVISAPEKSVKISNALEIKPLIGDNYQRWKIEKLNQATLTYKITELARYKTMSIGSSSPDPEADDRDDNTPKNVLKASNSFNNYATNSSQIWKISPVGDGTYIIATTAPSTTSKTGNIMAIPNNPDNNELKGKVIIAKNNLLTQRFRLIAID